MERQATYCTEYFIHMTIHWSQNMLNLQCSFLAVVDISSREEVKLEAEDWRSMVTSKVGKPGRKMLVNTSRQGVERCNGREEVSMV